MIYDLTRGPSKPLLILDFGPNNDFGTIRVGANPSVEMTNYLTKISPTGSSKVRKFIASDGQEYQWGWHIKDGQEWTCINIGGCLAAYYTLKTPGEPEYANSSGCVLAVEQEFGHLASEMLASLMIMRHIAAYNL